MITPDAIPELDPIRPALEDVGAIDWARTRDDDAGTQTGTFSAGTHPTAQEVAVFIDDALTEVRLRITDDLPPRLVDYAKGTVALLVAAAIERSYEPGTTASDDSAYVAFKTRFDERMALLMQATGDQTNTATETFGSVRAHAVGTRWDEQADDYPADELLP